MSIFGDFSNELVKGGEGSGNFGHGGRPGEHGGSTSKEENSEEGAKASLISHNYFPTKADSKSIIFQRRPTTTAEGGHGYEASLSLRNGKWRHFYIGYLDNPIEMGSGDNYGGIISHLKNVHGTPGALKTEQSGDLEKGGQGSGNFGHGGRPGERGGSSFHEVLDSAGWKLRDVEDEERKPGSRMRSIYTHSGFPNHQIMVYTKNGVGSEDTPKGEWIHYGGWPGTGNLPDPRTWATSNPDTESSYTPNIRGNDEGASSLEAYLRELEATKSGDLSDEDKKFLSDLGISEKVAKVLLSVLEKRAKKPKQQDQDEEPANEDFDFDEDQNGNDDDEDYLEKFANYLVKGGPGSGNFGHSGRPGEVGGSGGSSTQESNDSSFREKLKSIISNLPQKLRDALKHHLAPIVGGDLFLDTKAILGEKGKDSVEKLTSDHEAAASFHTEMAKHHFSGDKHMSTLGIDHEEAEKAHLDVICAIRSKNLEKISELDELAKSKSSWVLSKEFYV